MPLTRSASWTLFGAAGFALLAAGDPSRLGSAAFAVSPVARQDKKDDLPRRPTESTQVMGLKSTPIPPEKVPAAKTAFKAFAGYFADYVAHPRV
ncbi:MAG TPA: hypothetical protein VMY88_07035, partial [Acidimicrobiales bacterium]|nr:hypothetical protein [Acidimicrobiales bacterium]